jgi:hypothetical protein
MLCDEVRRRLGPGNPIEVSFQTQSAERVA